jgi:hypothetical protein
MGLVTLIGPLLREIRVRPEEARTVVPGGPRGPQPNPGRRNERKRWIFGEHPRRGTSGSSSSSERCKNGLRIRLANGSSSSFPDTSETRSYLVGDTLNL